MAGFDFNSITLSGGLTRDPELTVLDSGTKKCSMRLAYNNQYKNSSTGEWEKRSNYIDLVSWKGLGEWHANNLRKGTRVVVEGELLWREWQTDNGARQAYEIRVNTLVVIGRADDIADSGFEDRKSDIPDDGNDFQPVAAGNNKPGDEDIPF